MKRFELRLEDFHWFSDLTIYQDDGVLCIEPGSYLPLHEPDELRLLRVSQHILLGLVPVLNSGFVLLRFGAENKVRPQISERATFRRMNPLSFPWR